MSEVFISYSRRDKPFVQRLHQALSKEYNEVWVDWEDIPASADWWREIQAGIDGSDTFVFVVTPESVRSDVCREEIEYAIKHNKRFVPIIHKNITDEQDQASIHPAVKTHNWILVREEDDFDKAFQQLVNTVNTDLDYTRMHTRLLVRAREWVNKNHKISYLLDGDEIHEAEDWLAQAIGKHPTPTDLHSNFIFESRKFQTRRQRRLLAGAGTALVVAIILTIVAIFFGIQANSNANNAATNEADAILAQATSQANYELAIVAQATSQSNADLAATNLAVANAEATNVANERDRAESAESEALLQANIASTNAQNALIAQQTSQANADLAAANLTVANEQATAVADQRDRAELAEAEALLQADIAGTNAISALLAQQTSDANANLASTQEAIALQQANIASTNEGVANAEATNVAVERDRASTAEAEALVQANIASTNAQEAVIAQQTSDANYILASTNEAQALSAQQTSDANAERAAIQEQRAIQQADIASTNAQEAVIAQQTSDANANLAATSVANANAEATNVAIERDRAEVAEANALIAAQLARTNESQAVFAQQTSDANAERAAIQEQRAILNEQVALDAQATAEYNAQQALSQALAFNAQESISNGNYDLALALALESAELNPSLIQTQQLINELTYSGARFSFDNSWAGEISPNEQFVVSSEDNVATIWDIQTRDRIQQFEGHTLRINDATFSPDNTLLATASEDSLIILWDVASGQQVRTLAGHNDAVNDIEFSSDGLTLLSGSDDTTAILWEVVSGEQIRQFNGNPSPIIRLRFGETSQRFFTFHQPSANEQIMSIWDTNNNQPRSTVDDPIFQIFDPLGRTAVAGGDGDSTIVYRAYTLEVVRELTNGFNWTTQSATAYGFRPETGAELMLGLFDRSLNQYRLLLVDLANQTRVDFGDIPTSTTDNAVGERVDAIGFHPDGNTVLVAFGGILRLYNIETQETLRELTAHNDTVTSIIYSATGRFALSRSRDNNFRVWDMNNEDPVEVNRYVAETAFPFINSPGISPDNTLVYGAVETSMFVWNLQSAERLNSIGVGEILNTVYSPVDPYALIVTQTVAFLYNMSAGQYIYNDIAVGQERLTGVATFSPDGQYIVVQGNDLYMWNINQRSPRYQTFSTANFPPRTVITDMQLTPDNRYLLVALGNVQPESAPDDLIVFDVETGAEINRFGASGHLRTIKSIAISPDGENVVTASADDTLVMWKIESGRQLLRFVGHTADVNVVRFSPDGRTILSASDDTSLILWSVDTGQPIREYTSHTEPVTGLYISTDGTLAVSSTGSNSIIVWRIETLARVIEWTYANRFVPQLTCVQRAQFNVPPLCED